MVANALGRMEFDVTKFADWEAVSMLMCRRDKAEAVEAGDG